MAFRDHSSLFRAALALAFLLVLAACTPGGQFDPTEVFNSDMFDSKTKLIHTILASAANVSDVDALPHLLHGRETRVWV